MTHLKGYYLIFINLKSRIHWELVIFFGLNFLMSSHFTWIKVRYFSVIRVIPYTSMIVVVVTF